MAVYDRGHRSEGHPYDCGVEPGVCSSFRSFVTHQQLSDWHFYFFLLYSKSKIEWECDNGGDLWPASVAANYSNSHSFPTEFCLVGFPTINTAFIVSLLVDLGFQVRLYFLDYCVAQPGTDNVYIRCTCFS